VNFTNKEKQYILVTINDNQIPHSNTAKYLGMTLDAKLRWKVSVKKKREKRGLKYRKMYWLLGRRYTLCLHNKLMLYKQILKPVWTYGIQLWGCNKQSNINTIQHFQHKVLRSIVDAPWYVRNSDLHRDLEIDTADKEKDSRGINEDRLHQHTSVKALQFLDNSDTVRSLKRVNPSS
jgi:hypothetical protein